MHQQRLWLGCVLRGVHTRRAAPMPFFSCNRVDPNGLARVVAEAYRPSTSDPRTALAVPDEAPRAGRVPAGYVEQRRKTPVQWLRVYRQLSKSRLTFLVVLSGMMGYSLCPAAYAAPTALPSVVRLLALAGGITLCSTAANTLNQMVEAPYDAQMARTRARPLPRRAIAPAHAMGVAACSAAGGVAVLGALTNPLTAALGALNVALYAFVYTPMKRHSIANTWVGAVVGALPPLMGWASCTGTLMQPTDAAGWILAGILFAWQFPHFNALAHAMGNEYALALVPLCGVALPLTGTVLPVTYAALSLVPNAAFAYYALRFWRVPSERSARQCFWMSLFHLPAVMLLAMACKADMWTT